MIIGKRVRVAEPCFNIEIIILFGIQIIGDFLEDGGTGFYSKLPTLFISSTFYIVYISLFDKLIKKCYIIRLLYRIKD